MAYNLGSLITLVQKRVRDTNYDSTEITQYLNDAQNDVCNEYRLNFMEAYQDYTTVANVADITNGSGLPSDYLVAIDIVNISNGNLVQIPYKDVISLDQLYGNATNSSQVTSAPEYWYMYVLRPYLFPTPTVSYTLRLRYYKSPTTLSSNTDVPLIPAAYQELLVVGAASRVLQVKDNYDQAAILQNKFDEQLAKLVNNTAVNQVGKSPQQRINRYSLAKRNF